MPVFKSSRKVPATAIGIINEELDRLEKCGIIKKVDYSKWTVPTVCIKREANKTRLCANFSTGLNNCLKTCHHPLSTPEDIFAKSNGGKFFFFFKLNLSYTYLQIRINDKCSKHLTINRQRGLYRYIRLPFGLKVAPAIFQ